MSADYERNETLVPCQFNPAHKVLRKRYFNHAFNCRKNFSNRRNEPIITPNLSDFETIRKEKISVELEDLRTWAKREMPHLVQYSMCEPTSRITMEQIKKETEPVRVWEELGRPMDSCPYAPPSPLSIS